MTDKTQHTPEPWVLAHQNTHIYIEDEKTGLNQVVQFKYGDKDPKDEANAARIVECVNALAGIDNPAEWVEKVNKAYQVIELSSGLLDFLNTSKNENNPFTSRIAMFDEDNDATDIILWASPANVCESPIIRVIELRKEINELNQQIEQLKTELNKLKGE